MNYRSWVMDNGSLTQRLKDASEGDFFVNLTYLGWGEANLSERRCMNKSAGGHSKEVSLVREVELICRGQAWVRARSIIPASTLRGAERQLKFLGTKPLGEFLFKSRNMTRSPLQAFCQYDAREKLFGRRSVFFLNKKPLLVSELFLPALFDAQES